MRFMIDRALAIFCLLHGVADVNVRQTDRLMMNIGVYSRAKTPAASSNVRKLIFLIVAGGSRWETQTTTGLKNLTAP